MMLDKNALIDLYRRRARRYDVTANLYHLIEFRESAYRRAAVRALSLRAGDSVIEIGCGTGLNFPLLERPIGASGRLVGVDLTDAMLYGARDRVKREGWTNVDLVPEDAARFRFPANVGGVISTFALTLVPEYDRVIAAAAAALAPGRRFVLLDLKRPSRAPEALVRLMVWLTRPFGVTLDIGDRHPWESLARHLRLCSFEEFYFGFAYLAVGERP
jgi:ubiquinone/menaquinone biosynthesis C-methylase UbiE